MDIKETAANFIEQSKAALDVDGDGKVEAREVVEALAQRVDETVDAATEAAGHIKDGFDANADGKVTLEEVADVAGAMAGKAKDAVEGFIDKLTDK